MQIQIEEYRVRGAGDKVRRVGDDAHHFIEQLSPRLSNGLNCNSCLPSMSTLRSAVQNLEKHTRGLAATSQTLGGNVVQAAANHAINEAEQTRNVSSFGSEIRALGGN